MRCTSFISGSIRHLTREDALILPGGYSVWLLCVFYENAGLLQ